MSSNPGNNLTTLLAYTEVNYRSKLIKIINDRNASSFIIYVTESSRPFLF